MTTIATERPTPAGPAPGGPRPGDTTPTVLEPPRGWQVVDARELWAARELVFFLAWRDVKVRYKQTLLGAAWAAFQPLMMMIVFSAFFGRLADVPTGGVPYPLFVLIGLIPWTFFAAALTAVGNSIVGSERLITKVYFPRLAVPVAAVGVAAVDFAVASALLGLAMAWYRVAPGAGCLLMPAVFALVALLAFGLGTLLAAMNVTFRDVKYVIPFLIQCWMFATPTIYMDASAARGRLSWLLALNPMTTLVSAFRSATLGRPIAWGPLALAAGAAALATAVGCLYFRRMEDSFADVI